ncbi:hypothetical protein DYBT9275_05715 [Dyadobacter sp. CECT 9275]|uniref:Cytochrome c domain-containing protein n=1 Tax=Dyadobacter helix TaxID=2822344 RepID=A0A916JIT9_9BACT|nr:c-type cytochrome domain-containing protein [Dyadobacter sp. CECT 9275]CAG5017163.1 hypothetical protein DYBT9275_05715 [Dyadobacter sp. CECT 9275]
MNYRIRTFAEQLLFVLNIFIAFILFFEDKLVLPAWLQSVGRLHPLILHFPIVMLFIAMLMGLFRFRPENESNPYYLAFLQNLLLSGVILAGITVIMGLFLSREDGYSGSTLLWHKWTGAGIFFLGSVIYWFRNKAWYRGKVAQAVSLLCIGGLVVTGHYGAALTHGANFILEPLASESAVAAVPVEQAKVYEHVIKPIFEQKCVSCHNQDKLKGELMLTDMQSILKGGKSGKLFVPGNPQISLLLERIHLPMEEKEHMPPSGKTQLTAQEVSLLALWVRNNADFKLKVTDLANGDSLRVLATSYLKPATTKQEEYDFSPADEETVAKLNTDYRTILPLARESPALAVNIYNRNAYTSRQLEELEDIKKQIISLNLNKMPVKDSDLSIIAKFENLRRLDLNFTDITAGGLKALAPLKHLHSLTLSGTKVSYQDLSAQINQLKGLKTVTLWDTGLATEDIEKLRKANVQITFIGGFKDDGKNPLQLNPPQVKNPSMVFNKNISVQLRHPIKGVEIRYTTDGTIPDSLNAPVFSHMDIHQNTQITARAFKKGWYGSVPIIFDFLKNTYIPDSVRLLLPLNRVHQAEGAHTFFDGKLGAIGANNPAWANNWAGVRDNDMVLVSGFKQPVTISSVGLHYMIEEDTGIFPPDVVEVWGGNDPTQLKLLTKFKAALPSKGDRPSLKMTAGNFKPQQVTWLKIVAKPLNSIPDWHRNKGKKALLLVDEMFIN